MKNIQIMPPFMVKECYNILKEGGFEQGWAKWPMEGGGAPISNPATCRNVCGSGGLPVCVGKVDPLHKWC